MTKKNRPTTWDDSQIDELHKKLEKITQPSTHHVTTKALIQTKLMPHILRWRQDGWTFRQISLELAQQGVTVGINTLSNYVRESLNQHENKKPTGRRPSALKASTQPTPRGKKKLSLAQKLNQRY